MIKAAILDDYQNVSQEFVDLKKLLGKYEIKVFSEPLNNEAEAIEKVFAAIHKGDPTNDLIAIKYLESLEKVAEGKATKIFLPADLSATLGSIGAISELFKDDDAKGSKKSTKK